MKNSIHTIIRDIRVLTTNKDTKITGQVELFECFEDSTKNTISAYESSLYKDNYGIELPNKKSDFPILANTNTKSTIKAKLIEDSIEGVNECEDDSFNTNLDKLLYDGYVFTYKGIKRNHVCINVCSYSCIITVHKDDLAKAINLLVSDNCEDFEAISLMIKA